MKLKNLDNEAWEALNIKEILIFHMKRLGRASAPKSKKLLLLVDKQMSMK